MEKLKFAFYWAASCGGCEIAVLDIHEKILDVVERADILFWPVAIDTKYKDVEAMEDGYIDVCFFNGAVRLSEQEHIAKLLRKKSKTLVAFGSCACFGGIPGLANFSDREGVFKTVYKETESTDNPEFTTPKTEIETKWGKLELPEFYDTVKALHQVVDVDYFLPGCPPAPENVIEAVQAIFTGNLPPKGSVLTPNIALCENCPRKTEEPKEMEDVKRPHESKDDGRCFLMQGIICLGPATRSGCGARCINANMPCRGCYGPTDEVKDQGAKAISAIASVLGVKRERDMTEEEVMALISKIKDPAGTFYRFSLPVAFINRKVKKGE